MGLAGVAEAVQIVNITETRGAVSSDASCTTCHFHPAFCVFCFSAGNILGTIAHHRNCLYCHCLSGVRQVRLQLTFYCLVSARRQVLITICIRAKEQGFLNSLQGFQSSATRDGVPDFCRVPSWNDFQNSKAQITVNYFHVGWVDALYSVEGP